MTHYLDLEIRTEDDDRFTIRIYEPESGEQKEITNYFHPDEHPTFDTEIGQEIYSWISMWMEE